MIAFVTRFPVQPIFTDAWVKDLRAKFVQFLDRVLPVASVPAIYSVFRSARSGSVSSAARSESTPAVSPERSRQALTVARSLMSAARDVLDTVESLSSTGRLVFQSSDAANVTSSTVGDAGGGMDSPERRGMTSPQSVGSESPSKRTTGATDSNQLGSMCAALRDALASHKSLLDQLEHDIGGGGGAAGQHRPGGPLAPPQNQSSSSSGTSPVASAAAVREVAQHLPQHLPPPQQGAGGHVSPSNSPNPAVSSARSSSHDVSVSGSNVNVSMPSPPQPAAASQAK